jgi:hypothetical protein
MTRSTRILLIGLAILAVGSVVCSAEEDEIHSCVDEQGNIVIQSDPCPEPGPKAPPSPPTKKKVARQPGPKEPDRSQTSVAKPPKPKPPPAARVTTTTWKRVPRTDGHTPEPPRSFGRQRFRTSLSDAAVRSAPSFVTPERTWQTFLFAIETGDREGAVDCLTPAALAALSPDADSFPLEELRTMLGSFSRIESVGDLGPYWSICGLRTSQRPKWIFFEEINNGEWKISAS